VRYGRFDSERLVSTLTWTDELASGNPVLAIEHDGIHAAEGLILARYFMFTQVYFHKVRRAYDYHLGEALRSAIGHYPEVNRIDEYLEWDDMKVYHLLREVAAGNSQGADHARRILERDHYRVAFSTNEHPTPAQVRRWDQLVNRVRQQFGDQVAFDSAEKAPHKFTQSLRAFPVLKREGGPPTAIEEESGLIEKLDELRVCRILAQKELCDEVGRFCEGLNLNVN
jgi:HD superfamily phosphohydrolase